MNYSYERQILQVLQHGGGPTQWVLKTPGHLFVLPQLFAAFGDAWVIQTHRDPARTMASTANITAMVHWMRFSDVDAVGNAHFVHDAFAFALNDSVNLRATGVVPDEQFVDVNYVQLVTDPVATLGAALEQMGLSMTDAYATAVRDYLWGLVGLFERDPSAPRFERLVTPNRKLLGDNPDTVYFEAPISAEYAYRVRGETKDADYLSITVESSAGWGSMDNQVLGVLNDTTLDVDADGRFEIVIGGEPQEGNWLAPPPEEGQIISRHYFEDATHAGTDPDRWPAMQIEVIDGTPPPRPSDSVVSAGIRRVAAFIRELTVDRVPMAQGEP